MSDDEGKEVDLADTALLIFRKVGSSWRIDLASFPGTPPDLVEMATGSRKLIEATVRRVAAEAQEEKL